MLVVVNFDASPPSALSSRDFRQVVLALFGASFTMHHDLLCHRESLELFSEEVDVAEFVMSVVEKHNALLMQARLRGRHSPSAICFNNAGKRTHTTQVPRFTSLFVPYCMNIMLLS